MNCESLPLMLNAALDDELTAAERAEMQQHLAGCPACQELWTDLQTLDHELTESFKPSPVEPFVERILQQIKNQVATIDWQTGSDASSIVLPINVHPVPRRPNRQGHWVLFAVVGTLLIAVSTIFLSTSVSPAIAEILLVTGPVDVKSAAAADWVVVDGSKRISLQENARVRTKSKSLCEIRTKSDAIVRLNQETELVIRRAGNVELVTGEVWCRAPVDAGLQVSCSSLAEPPQSSNVFSCAAATEIQWKTLPNHVLSCTDVSTTPVEIRLPQEMCTLEPGESLTLTSNHPPVRDNRRHERLGVTNWQLPLLVLGRPDDLDVRSRLTGLLAAAGQTKASYMYEDQIRQLGPPGAIPLIAYVRSKDSLNQPSLRLRAMYLASGLAPASTLPDLELLLQDDDPLIRKLAMSAIVRLQPERSFSND